MKILQGPEKRRGKQGKAGAAAGSGTGSPPGAAAVAPDGTAVDLEKMEGTLEKIIFYSEESGYLVGRLRCPGSREAIPIVGSLPAVQEGEGLTVSGRWQVHARYGRQFQVALWQRLLPSTAEGLQRYLASGLIKGIGPVTAAGIVRTLGLQALEIMEREPGRLREVEGIGPKKAELILRGVREHSEMQQVMVFLQGHGIGPGVALRLYRHYGPRAVEKVRENPYRLAEEVYGIGFKIADAVARRLGMPPDSPQRVQAAMVYVLGQAADEGHVYLPREQLFARVGELTVSPEGLPLPADFLEQNLDRLAESRRVIREGAVPEEAVYKAPFYHAELGAAERLLKLLQNPRRWPPAKVAPAMAKVVAGQPSLTGEQRAALQEALESGVLVVTGGPGTGKTTTIRALLTLFLALGQKVVLAAPTGRAAKRITEATGREALTLHRLLEYSFQEGEGFGFQRNEGNPVKADVVIVDEASMVDLLLMFHLLKALPEGCRLIAVGDVDQLPSVGAGNVLRDIIASGAVPCRRLQNIFRQARESMIVVNAHRVNQGQMPLGNDQKKDFFFITEEDPHRAADLVVKLCRERLPRFGPYDPLKDIQVLAPMRRTAAGVDQLNLLLQEALNPPAPGKDELKGRGFTFRLGDRVMQIRNNYQKEVFNGDIGTVTAIDQEEGELVVTYPDLPSPRPVTYEFSETEELVPSYAVSVHKSQGSEYPVIVMPVLMQHYPLLQRNLLYTGITRARRLAVLIGSKKAVAMAVRNNRVTERFSLLALRLAGKSAAAEISPPCPCPGREDDAAG